MFKKLLAALVTLLILPTPAVQAASANNFYFKDFTADYYLSRDEEHISHMKVVEQLTAVFPSQPQNHGITRVIPFTNNDGQNLTMASDKHLKITAERNGAPEKISDIEAGDGYFIVYIGDADRYVTGEQTYTLTYEFENLILDLDDQQELYWDINGNDWQQKFLTVTARIHLDQDIAQSFTGDTSCYTGAYGASDSDDCSVSRDGDIITFQTHNLYSHEGMTVDLVFEPNTFAMAPPRQNYRLIIVTIIATLTGIAMLFLILFVRQRCKDKRTFYQGLFVKPEYTPPRDLTVAEAAKNYVGPHLRGDARVATILDLAVRHKIELIKTEQKNFFGQMTPHWAVKIKSVDLNQQEMIVLQILAGSQASLEIGQQIEIKSRSATSTLMKLARKFDTTTDSELKRKEYLEAKTTLGRNKGNWAALLQGIAAIWMAAWGIAFACLLAETSPFIRMVGGLPLWILLSCILIGVFVALIVVGAKNSKYFTHTQKGLEASRYLEGLHQYMKLAEADRLKMLQSAQGADTSHEGVVKLYEKLLPYATLFGLEESWLTELGKYYEFDDVAQPNWYVGVGVFSAHEFSSALAVASRSISSSIAHSTSINSSSSSSGSGGGGFSGGGGGGGGGGGW